MLFLLLACQPSQDSTPAELPPVSQGFDSVDTGSSFTIDTSTTDGTSDLVPAHTLTMHHEGSWLLTPLGGPYQAITGSLEVREFLDGDTENPSCLLVYSLTGTAAVEAAPGCSDTFDVTHYLSEGDPTLCVEPDLPTERETLGWDGTYLWLNWQDTGLWMEWYEGVQTQDTLVYSWEQVVGTDVPEEEE